MTQLHHSPVPSELESDIPPSDQPPKKQGGFFLVVLSLMLAIGLAWGGFVAARQIRQNRSREFLLGAIEEHLRQQRPFVEKIGSIDSLSYNEEMTQINAAKGYLVFDVAGSRGSGQIIALQRPNGLEFQLRMGKAEPVGLDPLVTLGR